MGWGFPRIWSSSRRLAISGSAPIKLLMSSLPPAPTQSELTDALLKFLEPLPSDLGLDWVKDRRFLHHFEAARLLLIREALLKAGVDPARPLQILDFGYLHGLIPEFLQRF